ncbi:protein kinase domain-containing protein [Nonomuraea soli]|uniref:non-specific serine/threonine protein kinase n=1 Tax=Nonomuraea soli TaxID=1032476 RepID=A0A7W0HPC9_9ACTN|nr:protein kinase [Nonomuraea soli]MBA2890617.1 serine/threonine protein kinase [Nonomuraea soli]
MGQQGPLTPQDPPAVGSYRLTGRLGSGGMGTVYLATSPDGAKVALKAIRRDYAADPVYRERFHEEVSNAQRVASFCTARVLDHGEDNGVLYLVTEYIEGVSLEDHLLAHGALPHSMLHSVGVGVAAALTAIHAAGLVHRDLKPANVMLTLAGPRVIDFGLARSSHVGGSRHTNVGMVMGTPGWIAPEQVFEGRTSPAADVFAWGSLIAYAGLGGHPFGSGDAYVMAARARTAPPDLRGLPAPLDRLVATAIHPDPARRPSATQLLLELVGAAESGGAQQAANRFLTNSWDPAAFPPPVFGTGQFPEQRGARGTGQFPEQRPHPASAPPPSAPPQGVPPQGVPPQGVPQGPPAGPPQGAPPQGPPPASPSQGPMPASPSQGPPPASPSQGATPQGPPSQGAPQGPPPGVPQGLPPQGPPSQGAPQGPLGAPASQGPLSQGPSSVPPAAPAGAPPVPPAYAAPPPGAPASQGPAPVGPAPLPPSGAPSSGVPPRPGSADPTRTGPVPYGAGAPPSHAGGPPNSHASALPSHASGPPSHASAPPSHATGSPSSHASAPPGHASGPPSHAGAPSHAGGPVPPGHGGAPVPPGRGLGPSGTARMPHPHARGPLRHPHQPAGARRGLGGGCLAVIIVAVILLGLLIGMVWMILRAPAGFGSTGEAAHDGRLAFTVTKSACPKPRGKASTRTCTISLKVRNTGQEGRVLYPGHQKLVDAADAAYAAARLLDRAGRQLAPTRVEPGGSFTGALVFELPTKSRPRSVELHDSGLSRGVRVPLA